MKILMTFCAMLTMSAFTTPGSLTVEAVPGGAYLKVNGKFGGEITQKELTRGISLEIDGCAAGARIYKYTLIIDRGGKTSKHTGESNELSKDMLAEISALESGDSFRFESVKARLGRDDKFDVVARPFTIA